MGQNETTTNELLLRIKEKYKKMSKGQRRLADYVCNDYDKAVFLTAAKLGEIVGVRSFESATAFRWKSNVCRNQIAIVAMKMIVKARCKKSFALSHISRSTFFSPGRR